MTDAPIRPTGPACVECGAPTKSASSAALLLGKCQGCTIRASQERDRATRRPPPTESLRPAPPMLDQLRAEAVRIARLLTEVVAQERITRTCPELSLATGYARELALRLGASEEELVGP